MERYSSYSQLESLLATDTLSQEGFVTDIFTKISTVFRNGRDVLVKALALSAKTGFVGTQFRPKKGVQLRVTQLGYDTLMPQTIYIPMGLTGQYLDYVNVLKDASVITGRLEKDVLSQSIVAITNLITRPELINTQAITTLIRGVKLHQKEIADIKKRIDGLIVGGYTDTNSKFSGHFKRAQDFNETVDVTLETAAIFAKQDPHKIQEKVRGLVELFDRALVVLGENSELAVSNKKNILLLERFIYDIAEEVAFFSSTQMIFMELERSLLDTCDRIMKL